MLEAIGTKILQWVVQYLAKAFARFIQDMIAHKEIEKDNHQRKEKVDNAKTEKEIDDAASDLARHL